MAEAQYAPNHTIDPETGFIENKAYPCAFDAERKKMFLEVFKNNGLGFYRTCETLGISHSTVTKHYHSDPVFKQLYDDSMKEYADELEAVSRSNALNPKSVIERIFQLKALIPEKYADQRKDQAINVSISIDPQLLSSVTKRQEVLEAEEIRE